MESYKGKIVCISCISIKKNIKSSKSYKFLILHISKTLGGRGEKRGAQMRAEMRQLAVRDNPFQEFNPSPFPLPPQRGQSAHR